METEWRFITWVIRRDIYLSLLFEKMICYNSTTFGRTQRKCNLLSVHWTIGILVSRFIQSCLTPISAKGNYRGKEVHQICVDISNFFDIMTRYFLNMNPKQYNCPRGTNHMFFSTIYCVNIMCFGLGTIHVVCRIQRSFLWSKFSYLLIVPRVKSTSTWLCGIFPWIKINMEPILKW